MTESNGVTVLTDDNGLQREYTDVKRKASVGDKVRVFDHATGLAEANGLQTVTHVDIDGHITYGEYGRKPNGYVVLAPTSVIRVDGTRYNVVERKADVGDTVIYREGKRIARVVAEGTNARSPQETYIDTARLYGGIVIERIESDIPTSAPVKDRSAPVYNDYARIGELERKVIVLETGIDLMTATLADVGRTLATAESERKQAVCYRTEMTRSVSQIVTQLRVAREDILLLEDIVLTEEGARAIIERLSTRISALDDTVKTQDTTVAERVPSVGDRVVIVDGYASNIGLRDDFRYGHSGIIRDTTTGSTTHPYYVEVPETDAHRYCKRSAFVFVDEYIKPTPNAQDIAEGIAKLSGSKRKVTVSRADVRSTASPSRQDVIAQAKADVAELSTRICANVPALDGAYETFYPQSLDYVDYVINRDKRTVIALLRYKDDGGVWARGKSRCAPDDVFNTHIGCAIALRRALGLAVPEEYVKSPQPTGISVGDIVMFDGNDYRYEVVGTRSNSDLSGANLRGYAADGSRFNAFGGRMATARVVDDSGVDVADDMSPPLDNPKITDVVTATVSSSNGVYRIDAGNKYWVAEVDGDSYRLIALGKGYDGGVWCKRSGFDFERKVYV